MLASIIRHPERGEVRRAAYSRVCPWEQKMLSAWILGMFVNKPLGVISPKTLPWYLVRYQVHRKFGTIWTYYMYHTFKRKSMGVICTLLSKPPLRSEYVSWFSCERIYNYINEKVMYMYYSNLDSKFINHFSCICNWGIICDECATLPDTLGFIY